MVVSISSPDSDLGTFSWMKVEGETGSSRLLQGVRRAVYPDWMDGSDIQYIAQANHRANLRPFGIRTRDRRSHVYVIGKTGTGKSTLLRVMIEQDILAGNGVALLDPHGDLVEAVRESVPNERQRERDPTFHPSPLTD